MAGVKSWLHRNSLLAWTRAHKDLVIVLVIVLATNLGTYYLGARNAATLTELCRAGNTSRGENIILWHHFAMISKPPPHETPAAAAAREKAVKGILDYVDHIYRPRNCANPSQILHS